MSSEDLLDEPKVSTTMISRLEVQKGGDRLDLTLCELKKIPVDAINYYFGRPETLDLDLSFNHIRHIGLEFAMEMKHLKKLDLSRNELRKLPDNFGELDKLVYLDLHENKLETLPLSMGNMRRLTYLNVSGNLFRVPLKDVLGKVGSNISGLAMAELVVTLLQEVATAAEVSPTHSSRFPVGSRRSSKVHYRRRSSTLRNGNTGTEQSSTSEDDIYYAKKLKQGQRKKKKPLSTFGTGILKTIAIAAAWSILIPLFIAYIADTSYLESLARTHPTFDMIWTDYNYKRIHALAVPVASLLPRHTAWQLKGPLTSHSRSGILGFVAGIFIGIKNILGGMVTFAGSIFVSGK